MRLDIEIYDADFAAIIVNIKYRKITPTLYYVKETFFG